MPLISGTLQAISQFDANKKNENFQNASLAEQQREFNTQISSRYNDAKSIGLNPTAAILGASSGAQPATSAGSIGRQEGINFTGITAGLGRIVSSAVALKTLKNLGPDIAKSAVKVASGISSAKSIGSLVKAIF